MKLPINLLFIFCSAAVSAAVTLRDNVRGCCFSLVAQGTVNGQVGGNTMGENRIGTDFPQAVYCIYNRTIMNNAGLPCALLSLNGQFVCEIGSTPTSSLFTLADNGNLLHEGNSYYFACASPGLANDGSYNIFSDSIADVNRCTSITLMTVGFSCAALGRPSSSSTKHTTTTSADLQLATADTPAITQSATTSPTSCPTDISHGTYVAPNLIIPISPVAADAAYGTQYSASISPYNSTIFAFDIPHTFTGTCALIFLFPSAEAAQFPYTFSRGTETTNNTTTAEDDEEESGSPSTGLRVALLDGTINSELLTWAARPPVSVDYGVTKVFPGGNYTLAVGACAPGQRLGYQVASVGGVVLDFFQTTGVSPLGFWIVPC